MHTKEFVRFDITVALVSRKQEDRLWFHQIWSCNEKSKAKEVKERKKKEIRSIRYRWKSAGRALVGR